MTGNSGKVREAKHALEPLGFDVRQLVIDGVEISEPQCDDLEDVARSKLEQAQTHLPNPSDALMVEDAGLFVDALQGFPGVYSAYVLNTIGCKGMLRLMIGEASRGAQFEAVAAFLLDGEVHVSRGICRGELSLEASGNEGFGFDPIFIPTDLDEDGNALPIGEMGAKSTHGKPFGGIPLDEKQNYSHRHRALEGLLSNLDMLG